MSYSTGRNLALPSINGPAQKYLSKSSESLFHQHNGDFHNSSTMISTASRPVPMKKKLTRQTNSLTVEPGNYMSKSSESLLHHNGDNFNSSSNTLTASRPVSTKLTRQTKSLSVEDDYLSPPSDYSPLSSPGHSPQPSPRLRRLQLPRTGSLDLLNGEDSTTTRTSPRSGGSSTDNSPRRTARISLPSRFQQRPLGQANSLPLSPFDNILVPDPPAKTDALSPRIAGSPPTGATSLAPPSSPRPPRTPRDRSRSRSPYRGGTPGGGSTISTLSKTPSRDSMTSAELAPWDFPNSLRSHSPIPPRRLATINKRTSEDKMTVNSSDTSDVASRIKPGFNTTSKAIAGLQKGRFKKQASKDSQISSVDIVISNEEDEDHDVDDITAALNAASMYSDLFNDDPQWNGPNFDVPDSSDIFQQALAAMRNRSDSRDSSASSGSSRSDPGDLHIHRSSLVATQMAQLVPNADSTDLDTLEEGVEIPKFSDSSQTPWERVIQIVLDNIAKMRSSRKNSEPDAVVSGSTGTSPRTDIDAASPVKQKMGRGNWKRALALTTAAAPTKECLQTKGTRSEDQKKALSDGASVTSGSSLSDLALLLLRSKEARQALAEERAREQQTGRNTVPVLSMKSVHQMTKFIINASASCSMGGVSRNRKSSNILCPEVTKLPELCNNGRMMQRQRRDSLRLIRYMVEEASAEGDSTEVTSFDDLVNCRYLRTRNRRSNMSKEGSF